ncbi:MAG TPA: anti-sigma factor [Mucilaginibacter sp.]|nr:anti-sigma factor [Mucilaginibacter sp.]
MEDVKQFIESGILELYVLGDVSSAERRLVEDMIQKHPAVWAEVEAIERALESYTLENAVEPSEELRAKILNSLIINFAGHRFFTKKETVTKPTVITMRPPVTYNFYKYAFAVGMALLIVSMVAIYSLSSQLQEKTQQLFAANMQNQQIAKTVNYINSQLGVFRDTSYKILHLKGTKNLPEGNMILAWNPIKKKVIIDLKSLNIPVNDKNHQYQLWALIGSEPIDLGVFDKVEDGTDIVKEMKSVALAQAFAVTREPRGGSAIPTMSDMLVIGQF